MDFVVLFAQFTSFQEPNDLRLLRFFFFFIQIFLQGVWQGKQAKVYFICETSEMLSRKH